MFKKAVFVVLVLVSAGCMVACKKKTSAKPAVADSVKTEVPALDMQEHPGYINHEIEEAIK